MDPASVFALFQASLSPDHATRQHAEEGLKAASAHDGLLAVLMKIMASADLNEDIRKSAAVFFKNRVKYGWDVEESDSAKHPPIGQHDRQFIRDHIVQAIIELPPGISGILSAALQNILEHDFEKWTTFLPEVFAKLQSNDFSTMHGSLVCLHSLMKAFRYKGDQQKVVVDPVVNQFFSVLQPLGLKLVVAETPDAASMLRLIVKVVQKNLALDDILKLDPEARERHQWWKVKKWAFRALHLLLLRCQKKGRGKVEYEVFSSNFLEHFAPNILGAVLGEMEKCIQGVWAARHVRQQMSIFVADNCSRTDYDNVRSVKFLSTWALLKPHAQVLIQQFVFPQLCFSPEDEERWSSDPVEYVQREIDDFGEEDKVNPGAAAQYLLHKIVSQRFNQTIAGVLQFAHGILMAYKTNPNDPTNVRHKHGAIKMVATLSSLLLDKKSPVANQMEQFFVDHVFPEFRSPHSFLRAQAFEMLGHFDDLQFGKESQEIIFHGVLGAIQDPELPVRVYAAQTIPLIVEYESISEALKPHVASIMKLLLELTREIDMDNLTSGMELLALNYPDELAPFAVDLSRQMVESFMAIMSEIASLGDDDIEKKFNPLQAAAGILKTIATLIESIEKLPAALVEMESFLLPVVHFIVQGEVAELYEEIFQIPATFIYLCKAVSPGVWQLWPAIYKLAKETDYFQVEEMFATFDGFIEYGKDVVMQNPELLNQFIDVVRMVLEPSSRVEDDDAAYGCYLAETLLFHLGPYVQQ
ncbi:hypothetical protein HK405_008431, partial [Cladochytrium tenue]